MVSNLGRVRNCNNNYGRKLGHSKANRRLHNTFQFERFLYRYLLPFGWNSNVNYGSICRANRSPYLGGIRADTSGQNGNNRNIDPIPHILIRLLHCDSNNECSRTLAITLLNLNRFPKFTVQ